MSVAAAIRITSPDEERVIRRAAAFARREGTPCFVVSVVPQLPYGASDDTERRSVEKNLGLIREAAASPVMQEGVDIAKTLIAVARAFGVETFFVQTGSAAGKGRSIAEKLLLLDPPFDVVIVGSEEL